MLTQACRKVLKVGGAIVLEPAKSGEEGGLYPPPPSSPVSGEPDLPSLGNLDFGNFLDLLTFLLTEKL